MKKIILVFFQIIIMFFLDGCSRVSGLDERLIIYGIGVDKSENNYELIIQALNTKNLSDENSENESKIINITAKGKTLLEATSNIESQTGKKILYSHDLILILGKELAKLGINDIIKFFTTNHKLRPTVEVFISETTAKEIFQEKDDKKNSVNSEDILYSAFIGKEGDDAIKSNMRYLLGDLNNSYKGAKVWGIEKDENSNIVCKKIALFNDDKLIDFLDENMANAVVLLNSKAKNISGEINVIGEIIPYNINKVKSNINVEINNEVPIFYININVELDLYNSQTIDNNDSIGEIKNAISNNISNSITDVLNTCIKKYKCDIFNFNRYIINSDQK